ncbi:MAG: hypothetical protein Q7J55_00385 [bacterium]|nr:hypothetical protein [bacterium]
MQTKKENKRYYEILKAMGGEQRLKIGFEMWDFTMKLVEASIRNQYPEISNEELEGKIKERISFWSQGGFLDLWE